MTNRSQNNFYDVIVIGGGLAGLISTIELSKSGFKVLLLEKKTYPFHKVCGEYVSNEVLDYFLSLDFNPFMNGASRITRLRISDHTGKSIHAKLDMGGFGISRFVMDNCLVTIAKSAGGTIAEKCRVNKVERSGNYFTTSTSIGDFQSSLVIGSYGKRDLLDRKLGRDFINRHTGYMAIKYHVRLDYPADEIGLDNFPGGYCGIVRIEEGKYNVCYLYKRKAADDFKSVQELEEKILFKNPLIRNIFHKSEFLFSEPEAINEIYFEKKSCITDHILMCGDSAGLITPLCGNGMAMAVNGARILSDIITNNVIPSTEIQLKSRLKLEEQFSLKWKNAFSNRLFWGRNLQRLSSSRILTSSFLKIMNSLPPVEKWVIRQTHGKKIVSS